MPDLTVNIEDSGSVSIEVDYDYTQYSITYVIPIGIDSNYYTLENVTSSYTIQDTVQLPTFESNRYILNYWLGDVIYYDEIPAGSYGNKTLTANISVRSVTITFNANGGSYCAPMNVVWGATITLPTSFRTGYLGTWKEWGYLTTDFFSSNFGKSMTVTENLTLTALWKQEFSISYVNTQFGNSKAIIMLNKEGKSAPNVYYEGQEISVNQFYAFFSYTNPYSHEAKLRYIGLFEDEEMTQPAQNITSSQREPKTFYLKWEYNFGSGTRTGNQTITKDDPMSQFSDSVTLNLGLDSNLYNNLIGLGINKICISFSLTMYEIHDGQQTIFVYGGPNGDKQLATWGFSGTDTSATYSHVFEIDLSDLEGTNTLYFRYQGSKTWLGVTRNWVRQEITYEISYIAG